MKNTSTPASAPKTTIAETVRLTLRTMGKPMTIREITVAISGGFRHANVSHTSATVANLIAQGQVRRIISPEPGRYRYELL